jgi:ribonuclease G
VADTGNLDSDRSGLAEEQVSVEVAVQEAEANRPEGVTQREQPAERRLPTITPVDRSEFRAQRSRDRRIRQKTTTRVSKSQINIQDLLKEGQEVLVQVAKDPIATKGARLTCHISLPGRHLVCMPTIDHVGVSRRIEREDERRRLREYVERNRPKNLGFIVRTASGRQQSEKRIKQDIEYLTRLWGEIKEKASNTTAPALVYEDLNAVLRAIRDWVTEEIDKVIVDSRYHYNEIQRFVSHFMPPLKQKVELYHGDIPIFDAYGISTELSRALERKVWLKSGGYIVIDQAEALVAIDVNTGRYVGKKNLEDTILKTNLEAVQEIAYQLRLRNCGGIIILDFIDMEKDENKQRVYRALEDALARDRARPSILKISELGLVEMTRKRTRDTIVRTLCESCTHCEGKGFIKSKQTVAYEVMREIEREGIERDVNKILVQAHPDVIDILAIDERETLDQLERRYRKQIYLQAVTDFHPEQFEVTADKRERTDRGRERDRDRDHHTPTERSRHRERQRHEHHHPTPQPISASGSAEIIPIQAVITPVEHPVTPVQIEANSSVEPGNTITPAVIPVSPISSPLPNSGSEDGFYDEEDRLAFLRAQAAQDAALARLGNNHSTRTPNNENPGRMGNNNRRGNRGRRGTGKFRRGNDRSRDRNPKQFGYNNPGPKWNEPNHEAASSSSEAPSTNVEPAGGNTNTGGSSGGGGGDHSQPPI